MWPLPQLVLLPALSGSALAMKLAPVLGLLPGGASAELVAAYAKFVELPPLWAILGPLGLGAKGFMVALALVHLLAAALLALRPGAWAARAAGLWAMVAMVGAEYCTRATGFVPPGVPPKLVWVATAFSSLTHVALFCAGLCLCLRPPDNALRPVAMSIAVAKYREFRSRRAAARAAQASNEPSADRGRTEEAGGSRKRDSTPVPKAKAKPEDAAEDAGEGADGARLRSGAAARAAAAMGES